MLKGYIFFIFFAMVRFRLEAYWLVFIYMKTKPNSPYHSNSVLKLNVVLRSIKQYAQQNKCARL